MQYSYLISLIMGLLAAYYINKGAPGTNAFISFFLVPILVAYLTLSVIYNVFPWINKFGRNLNFYLTQKTAGNINQTGYIQIFPPLLAVLVLFFILLYNRNLG